MADRIPMTPALSDESMENKLVALAMEQAQKQLEAGTASSQIITHFLRLGSMRAQVELKELELKTQLAEAKIDSERAGQEVAKAVQDVLTALRSYTYIPGAEYDGDSNYEL